MKTIKRAAALALLVPALAHAEFFTGNQLYQRLNGDSSDRLLATGYVMGVFDTSSGVEHCGNQLPNVTAGQARDVVKQYLDQNPSTRDVSADLLARIALNKAWPCPDKKKSKGV